MLIPNNKALKDKLAKDEYELVLTLSNTTLTNQSIPNSKILQDSFSVNRFSVTGGTIEIGSATAAEMQVTIDNSDGSFDDWTFEGATIFARLKATISETAEYMDIGYFIVDEVVRQRDSIQLVCLDKMVWFDKAIVWSVEPNDGGFVFSTSPATLLNNICSACNVSYNSASFTANAINKTVTLAATTRENLTYRQLLQWLCQVIGVCAYINESGALTVAWYAQKTYSGDDAEDRSAQDIITPSNRFSSTIDRDPISISNVSVKVGETTYAANSNNTYTLAIDGNELINESNLLGTDNNGILSGLATRLVGFSYYPFTADVLGLQWLQPLDITTFVDKDDVEHTVIITDWTYSRGRNTQLAGKGESATRKGYASNPPFTAAQQRIIEEIKKNTPEVDIDDRIEAVFALNNAVNSGMMLHSTTIDGKVYYHNAATLADSDLIATANTGGFAWTTSGWNSGNPSWSYGISNDGAAVLQTLSTYSLNADLINAGQIDASQIDVVNLDASNITTGTLQSADGTVTVDLDNKSINFGNKLTYDPTNGLNIDGSVTIGGSASIGDTIASEVADAVEDLDFKGIDDQVVEYAISTSGSDVPSDEGTAGHTETMYAVLQQQSDDYLSTISTKEGFEAAYEGYEILTVAELFSYIFDVGNGLYIYRFTRTDTKDGDFSLGGWTYLGQLTTGSGVLLSATLYCAVSSGSTANASYILDEIDNNAVYAVPLVQLDSNGDLCVSFTANLTVGADITISDIATVYTKGSSSTSVIAEIPCFVSRTTRLSTNTSTAKTALKNSIDVTSSYVSVKYGDLFSSTFKYFYKFTATVKANGDIVIGDDYELAAEYGVSYPEFDDDVMSNWSITMPDVSANKGKYLWTRTTTTFTDNTSQISYQATYIGQNGAAGQPGQNGTSVSISSIKYAVNQDQSTQPSASSFSTTFPSLSQGDWLWTKTTYSNDSTAITKTYIGTDGDDGSSVAITSATKTNGVTTVVLTDGSQTKTLTIADGADGDDGDPGLNGYVHVAWANSADGTTDFSTSVSSGKTYLGTYTDNTAADSQSPSAYSWTLIKGAQGNPGNDGKGISSVTQYFHPDSSANIADIPAISDTSKWKTAPSDFTGSAAFSETNRYLWTYTKTVYTNPSSTVNGDRYILGVWGAPGSGGSGTQGRGITSIVTQYCLHTSNSTSARPAENYSGWSDDMPAYSDGTGGVQRYYWQRDKITYDQALNGSTIQYTTPTLMQGVNKTMLEVNTLNADFARVIVKQNNQTYINGANIYTGTVTTDALAANSITSGKIASGAITSDKITASTALLEKVFASSGIVSNVLSSSATDSYTDEPIMDLDFSVPYIRFQGLVDGFVRDFTIALNGLIIHPNNQEQSSYVNVGGNGLTYSTYDPISQTYKQSQYGNDAQVIGLIKGLEGGRISNLSTTSSVWNYTSVTFKKTYPSGSLPKIMLSYSVADGSNDGCVFVRYKNLTTSGFEVWAKSKDYSSTITVDWVAIP